MLDRFLKRALYEQSGFEVGQVKGAAKTFVAHEGVLGALKPQNMVSFTIDQTAPGFIRDFEPLVANFSLARLLHSKTSLRAQRLFRSRHGARQAGRMRYSRLASCLKLNLFACPENPCQRPKHLSLRQYAA